MPKVRHHVRGIPHGGESSGRASPEAFVGTPGKEDQWHRKCHIEIRQIMKTSGRTKGHQRERVLFPSTRESNPEGIYHDGRTILRNRGTTAAGQGGTRSLPDDKIKFRETKGGTHKHGRETTPSQIYQRVQEFLN